LFFHLQLTKFINSWISWH